MHPAVDARQGQNRHRGKRLADLDNQVASFIDGKPLPQNPLPDDGPPDATLGLAHDPAPLVEAFDASARFGGEAHREYMNLLRSMARSLQRIADRVDPSPSSIVGTPYVARLLDQTTTWVADMARSGSIPRSCVVPGTGNGKPWKFYRSKIEEWLQSR